jgi:hypothetical protein
MRNAPKKEKRVRTFKLDVNLALLLDKGIIRPGPKWPEGYPPGEVNFWVAVFVQEHPEDPGSCLAEASAYLCGSDYDPRDLGVNPDTAFEAVYKNEPMPWPKPFYGGPA